MKKYLIIIGIAAVAIVSVLISCNDEFLETQPKDRISSDATWADGALSEAFVFNVYSYLGYGGFEEQALAAYTDEAMFTHSGRNINTFTEGSETPSNLAWMSDTYKWDNMYLAIRQANIAIENLPKSTFADTKLRDRLLGEAHFLRGYYYQQLLKFYGGVPLISKAYGLNEDYEAPRNTFEETVNFIIADADKAAQLLDGKATTPGRTTKIAALALKSRVLTYAASDLHDPVKAAKSSVLGGYANKPLIMYTGGNQADRWKAAQAASKAVLDLASGYKLNLTAPVSPAQGTINYVAIAMGGGSAAVDKAGAEDLIFYRTLSPNYRAESNWPLGGLHYGINNGPNGYNNWGGNTPIQQLIDDYEMMDGTKFNWNNAAHKAAPYDNRDPRFDATILRDGSNWKPRPSSVAGIDPNNQIQTGFYDDGKGGTVPGVDTRSSSVENWNGTRTHYYTRKFIDPNPALPDNQSNTQVIPWPFMRVTEVALNYAEASLALGDETTARNWINKVRFRAGMPAVTDGGAALLARLVNERRIELQYEEHRYHDARRWMIAEQTLGRGIKNIQISAKLKPGAKALVPYKHDPKVYDYTYTVVDNTQNESRKWNDKMYYRPISRDEMNRNKKLVQNPGY
jgi:starch-binding outer membrane protein, SusD/RagB family